MHVSTVMNLSFIYTKCQTKVWCYVNAPEGLGVFVFVFMCALPLVPTLDSQLHLVVASKLDKMWCVTRVLNLVCRLAVVSVSHRFFCRGLPLQYFTLVDCSADNLTKGNPQHSGPEFSTIEPSSHYCFPEKYFWSRLSINPMSGGAVCISIPHWNWWK